MKKIFFILVFSLTLWACSKENEESARLNEIESKYLISIANAKGLLLEFIGSDVTTRSGEVPETTITDCKLTQYTVSNADSKSKSFENESIPVYEFTTITNGKIGYSIVIADIRIAKVLISVEQGSSADTLKIVPLRDYFRAIPEFIVNDLKVFYQKESQIKETEDITLRRLTVTTYYAFLPTLWGQGDPYNRNCPSCGTYNTPAGCVAIATAQILAYHKKPSSMSWNSILANPVITASSSSTVINEVASLIYTIGIKVNMSYSCYGGSSAWSDNVPIALNYYGMQYDSYQGYSLTEIASSLCNSRPVYMRGDGNYGSHAWVCDGYKQHDYGNGEIYNYLDMNWGEDGNSNGFYYADNPPSFNSFYSNLKIIPNIR